MKRLVTFLGTGEYADTHYVWPGVGEQASRFVAHALAVLWRPDQVQVLATTKARRTHGDALQACLRAAGIESTFIDHPDGRDREEQWAQFDNIQTALDVGAEDEVLLDITHGFRAQPFLAGAALAVQRAQARAPVDLRIVYGEYRREEQVSLVWSLDLFVELIDWALALGLFQRTGVAGPLVDLTERRRRAQARSAQADGSRDFPTFGPLVKAIEAFAADIATVRIAALTTGYTQDDRAKAGAVGSAAMLVGAIEAQRAAVLQHLPPLDRALDGLAREAATLQAKTLYGVDGDRAMLALAQYYLGLERYPEAAIVVREAHVNRHASRPAAVEVNSPDFDSMDRVRVEGRFNRESPDARAVADVRNDIQHGGFRRQPLAARVLMDRVADLLRRLQTAPVARAPTPGADGRVLFVSRHPGARDWAARQGLAVDEVIDHLDVASVRGGDTVIGSLPVNLAALLCANGVRYLHLALELPAQLRGQELGADDLERLGARLIEYRVSEVKGGGEDA